MKKATVNSYMRLKSINTAINHYKVYKLTTLKQILVFSYFCKVELSSSTDALKGIGNVITQEEFNAIISHLLDIGLLRQVNKRGNFKIYAPTPKGVKLNNMIIYV